MKLTEGPDIDKRFREELRGQSLGDRVKLQGNAMLTAVATDLLHRHAPSTFIGDGTAVTLMSMEEFCAATLRSMLEDADPPALPLLLYTIPEEEIIAYAERLSVAPIRSMKDDVRSMLDDLAQSQPQTYLSLTRSAQRLLPTLQSLRK